MLLGAEMEYVIGVHWLLLVVFGLDEPLGVRYQVLDLTLVRMRLVLGPIPAILIARRISALHLEVMLLLQLVWMRLLGVLSVSL